MKLAGKVAIVTGGSRGIGLAIAKALGAEGAKVAVASRTAKEVESATAELQKAGVTAMGRATDVVKWGDVDALVKAVAGAWGRVDVLVNAAGVVGDIGPVDEADLAAWKLAYEVNVFGLMHACKAVLPLMRAQGGGKIVAFAGGGVGGPGVMPRWTAYTSSKAAVVQFVESLSRELQDDGANVQINAVAPGAVVTEMTAGIVSVPREKAPRLYDQTMKQRASGGESPELAAKMIVWLASDASGALSGKMFSAKWDKVEGLDAAATNKSSKYALRRIDGELFDEVKKP